MATGTMPKGDLNFAADLFKAADKIRGSVEPSKCKHIAFGLPFLQYISDAFEVQRATFSLGEYADTEDPAEYLAANVFWVLEAARCFLLKGNARSHNCRQ